MVEYGGWKYEERTGGGGLNRALVVWTENWLEDGDGLVSYYGGFDWWTEVNFVFLFFEKERDCDGDRWFGYVWGVQLRWKWWWQALWQ